MDGKGNSWGGRTASVDKQSRPALTSDVTRQMEGKKMIKKMLLLASMALAAVAFAVPASASANWTANQAPLTENAVVEFSGPASFQIPGTAGAEATIHAEIELKAGSTTGTVLSFTDTSCKGTLGFAGLTCTGTARNLPWHVEVNGPDLVINDIDLLTHYYIGSHSETPVRQSVLAGDIIATPDDPEAIGTVTLSESENTTASGVPAVVDGDLAASPEGVYGF